MADKIPLKAIYSGSDVTALGEFETGDTISPAYIKSADTWTALSGTTPSITAGSHTWTLTGNSTPTDGLSDGDHCTLMVDDGSGYTIDWSGVVDQWGGGEEPTLPTSGYIPIVLWKIGSTVFGIFGQGMAAQA